MTTSMNSRLDAGLPKRMAAQKIRRRIDPRTGQALVKLGHAIEYLSDELVYEAANGEPNRGQLEAIHLLMARNRDLYLACPEVPSFRERLRSLFRLNRRNPERVSDLGSKLSHGGI